MVSLLMRAQVVSFGLFSDGDERSRALFRVRGSLPKRWAGLRMVDLEFKH